MTAPGGRQSRHVAARMQHAARCHAFTGAGTDCIAAPASAVDLRQASSFVAGLTRIKSARALLGCN
ncbi:hypothetical protein SB861_56305, partial [Paraburkholderia sp. SIMBA_049]